MYLEGVIGVPIVNWMLGHIGRKWSAVSIGINLAVLTYLYGSVTTLLLIVFFGLLFNVAFFGNGMVSNTYTPELFQTSMRATGVGYATGIGRIGAIIGPIIIGFLLQGYGVQSVFIFGAAMYLIGGLAVVFLGTETKGKVFTSE
jgi:putative MFS transporter